MKCVVNGRMADAAKIEEVMIRNGEMKGQRVTMATFTLFSPDPNGPKVKTTDKDGNVREFTKGIPLNCKAWGENAQSVRNLAKGDIVTGAATVRYGEHSPQFVISRLDPNHEIHKQMSSLITAYSNGEVDQIFDNEPEKEPPFREEDMERALEMQQSQQMEARKEHQQEMAME